MNKKFAIIGGITAVVILVGFLVIKSKSSDIYAKSGKGPSPQKLSQEAAAFKNNGDLVKAQESYQEIMSDYPDYEKIDEVQSELESVNLSLILSNEPIPNKTVVHEVGEGDSLAKIAKKYGTTVDLIKISNHLSKDTIRVGQKIRIWLGKFNIFVDKSQNVLILKDNDEVVKVYHVSTGHDNSTPVGQFKITSKLENPVWFKQGIAVPPESPENVLGTRWLGFDIPEYGIHGTTDPDKIGQQVTAGCVRMRNQEVEELYNLIPLGTSVTIVN